MDDIARVEQTEPAGGRNAVRLVAGLGNPGKKYAGTRHNAGFEVIDRFAGGEEMSWEEKRDWKAWFGKRGDLLLLKPATYMNLSGEAVGKVAAFYKLDPSQILIVYDDKDLMIGNIRIKSGGSAGGHNGMASVIQHLGTQNIPRLRIGIGSSPGASLIGHVLGRFKPGEQEAYLTSVATAAEAIGLIVEKGIDRAMNIYNKKQQL